MLSTKHASRLIAFLATCLACSDAAPPPNTADARAGDAAPPAVAVSGCGEGRALDETSRCVTTGIPPDACAPGFEADGAQGCRAILPLESCAKGAMAVPGDRACRPVAECGTETFPAVSAGAPTVFVDAAFAGAGDG